MEDIKKLQERMKIFAEKINANKELKVHYENKFNKQFGVLLKDWHYLEIIVKRIDEANPNNVTQLGLDLKSLYVFGRVFSESLLYIVALFIESTSKIEWTKIGEFIKSVEKNLDSESDEFKLFWKNNEEVIKNLYEGFRYRNTIIHEKDSNNEWTFTHPGRSNLDHVFIVNVPWLEDKETKREKRTLNTRQMLQTIFVQSSKIFDYLESRYTN